MLRAALLCSVVLFAATSLAAADSVQGTYVEARTCQVYTGPCFANGEVGSAGKNAVMTWQIDKGTYAGADLSGRCVAVVLKASHTLGFNGLDDADDKKAMVIIDAAADQKASEALKRFALNQLGLPESDVAAVQRADIEMQFDMDQLTAAVKVGQFAHLETRKARKGDCICSNESAYYPPLTSLTGFVPGVTIEGDVSARSLGTRWSIPDSRTAYLGTFQISDSGQLASKL